MQLYKQFDVGVVDPACNFTKNDNLQQVPGMGILPISYLLSGVLLIVSENNSESNERRIFAQSFQSRSSSSLELGQACMYVKLLPSWNTTDFSSLQWKTLSLFFLGYKASTSCFLIDFAALEACSHSLYFENNLLFCSFNLPCQRQKSTIIESENL